MLVRIETKISPTLIPTSSSVQPVFTFFLARKHFITEHFQEKKPAVLNPLYIFYFRCKFLTREIHILKEEISPPVSHPSHPPIPRKLNTHPSTPSRTPLAPLAHPSTTHSARTQNSSHPDDDPSFIVLTDSEVPRAHIRVYPKV